jgi:cardiolipin synthase
MEIFLQFILVLIYLFAFIAIVDAILHARTSQGAMAWTIALITLPLFSLPCYMLFGRRTYDKYIEARQHVDAEITYTAQILKESIQPYQYPLTNHEQQLQVLENLAPLPFTNSNSVELLIDGQKAFPAILESLKNAKRYIIIQFYIVRHDNIGHQIKQLLIDRAKEGLDIYFLYDSLGSFELNDGYVDDMKQVGINIYEFNSTGFLKSNRFQMNFRNHRKIVITDGDTAYIGGLNIGDEYLAAVPEFPVWRDTHLRLTGPCVQAIQLAFTEDWIAVTRSLPKVEWRPKPHKTKDKTQGVKSLLVLPYGPVSTLEVGTFTFLHLINSAKKRIWIASPYFIPDITMRSALQLAILRGVEVRVLIPEVPDNILNQLSTFAHVELMINTGIQFYFYEPGFMHQKIILVDSDISFLGTANFANRSFRLNFEISILVNDPVLAKKTENMLIKDFRNSHLITEKEMHSKPIYFRILGPIARLFSPVL